MKLFILVITVLIRSAFSALSKPEGCGTTKGCFTDCGDGSCSYAVTWSADGDAILFSLQHKLPDSSSNRWIALGLSDDIYMGDDSVTDCIMEASAVYVYKSYNRGELNEAFNKTERQTGLTKATGSVVDGVLTCSYKQSLTSSHALIKDLNTDWYLLVATGPSSYGIKLQHSLSPLPAVSAEKVDLQGTKDLDATAKYVLVKVHGSLMMYAWIFAASIGIVLARHYKRMWPNKKHCRERVWFAWHRLVMLTAFLTCVAAFVIIFIEIKAWSYLEDHSRWQKAHPYLGVIATAFCIINPILALFRCHPDSPHRRIFSWVHWFIGTVAHILAILAMIIGVTLDKASAPSYLIWIILAYAAYQFLMELFLEIFDCCFYNRSGDRYHRDGTMKDPRGSRIKKICLLIHVLIVTAFTAVCIILLAIN